MPELGPSASSWPGWRLRPAWPSLWGETEPLGGNHSLGASTPPSRKPSTLLCASLQELSELKAIEAAIGEFLDLGKSLKFDVTSREDINGYSGATPVLYNKFLFRAG